MWFLAGAILALCPIANAQSLTPSTQVYSQNFAASGNIPESGNDGFTSLYAGDGWSTAFTAGVEAVGIGDNPGNGLGFGVGGPQDDALVLTGNLCGNGSQSCAFSSPIQYDLNLYSEDNDGIGVVFGNNGMANGYLFFMSRDRGPSTVGADAAINGSRLYRIVNGTATQIATSATRYDTSRVYALRVLVNGANIQVWFDTDHDLTIDANEKLFDVTEPSAVAAGRVGVYEYSDTVALSTTDAVFDNLVVRMADTDSDTVGDQYDNCPVNANTTQTDADSDGFGAACDCNDADAAVHTGATEVCDGVDNDCDALVDDADSPVTGQTRWYTDADGDGFGSSTDVGVLACTAPNGKVANKTDCNDAKAAINPNAQEVCDPSDVDEDCDGLADDLDPSATGKTAWYLDADTDGYGNGNLPAVNACNQPAGRVADKTDCNDAIKTINPGAQEVCDPLDIDEDCDTFADDNDPSATGQTSFYTDADGDTYGTGAAKSKCDQPAGTATRAGDCDDAKAAVNPGAQEVCDSGNVDEDCDGLVNDADPSATGKTRWYTDGDADGFGAGSGSLACTQPAGTSASNTDCDDTKAAIHPGAQEICDPADADEDCDTLRDDLDPSATGKTSFYADADTDTYGAGTADPRCDALPGEVTSNTDCNDLNGAVNPGAQEVCNGIDDDCDGLVDGNDPSSNGLGTFYADADGDGFGDPNDPGVKACTAPAGHVANKSDCDDTDAAIHPGAAEVCDLADTDEDCDGLADDADPGATGQATYHADSDGDGYGDPAASPFCDAPTGYVADGTDCDDGDAAVNPGAQEVCDPANTDEDCDTLADDLDPSAQGQTASHPDLDGDGFGNGAVTVRLCDPVGTVADGTDCDDTNASVHGPTAWYTDADGDGFGTGTAVQACAQPAGTSDVNGDCDDTDAGVNPGEAEICDPADTDEDCDGLADDGSALGQLQAYADGDSDGYGGAAVGVRCDPGPGETFTPGDCDDAVAAVHPGATEVCNGDDDDCDGLVDDADPGVTGQPLWYVDADNDGFGDDADAGVAACSAPRGTVDVRGDCDDADKRVNPDAQEVCDPADTDEDCDGAADDLDPSATGQTDTYYADVDGDGYGDAADAGTLACDPLPDTSSDDTDCDDTRGFVNPGATEVCDASDLDEDCDGLADDADPGVTGGTDWHADADQDGFGASAVSTTACDAPAGELADATDCDDTDPAYHAGAAESCTDPDYNCDGFVGTADNDGDGFGACEECDDSDPAVNPAAVEACNAIDDDCDGQVDEAGATGEQSWFADADVDGYGDPATGVVGCTGPAGSVLDGTDCDDATTTIHPGALEQCNGIDDDCNGLVDDNAGFGTTAYADTDGDGFGDPATATTFCTVPTGYVDDATDCDDGDATVFPGATELCDGVDNDCDGAIDDGAAATNTFYADSDGDGYGDPATATAACTAPTGLIADGTDCDDGDGAIHPGATETCDGVDEDCDGSIDEGAPGNLTFHVDADGDGFGDPNSPVQACAAGSGLVADASDCDDTDPNVGNGFLFHADADGDGYGDPAVTAFACTPPTGYVDDDTDCDDTDPTVTIGTAWYVDGDGDGFGAGAPDVECVQPAGTVDVAGDCDDADPAFHPGAAEDCTDPNDYNCDGSVGFADVDGDGSVACLDCDDGDAAVHPGAVEVCDDVDDDCDGTVDVGAADAVPFYADADGDGYGDLATTVTACNAPTGFVADSTDCNDADPAYHPGAVEDCADPNDYNCDGSVGFADVDGDGTVACLDCDDGDAAVHPGAVEVCDDLDDDCDGTIDVGAVDAGTWYIDADGDGFGDPLRDVIACDQPVGAVVDGTDCDDTDASVFPGAVDVPGDGIDQDCDGFDEVVDTGDTGVDTDTGAVDTDTGAVDTDTGTIDTDTGTIDTDTGGDTDTDADSDSDSDADTDADSDADTDSDSDTDAGDTDGVRVGRYMGGACGGCDGAGGGPAGLVALGLLVVVARRRR
jgi:hypothetical protein